MKQLITIFAAVVILFTSCNPDEPLFKKVTIDFFSAADQTVITFTGNNGQGSYAYNSQDGVTQYKYLPNFGTYNIKYEVIPQPPQPNSCTYFFESISNPGTGGTTYEYNVTLNSEYGFSINCR